jgi:hypothetical protein
LPTRSTFATVRFLYPLHLSGQLMNGAQVGIYAEGVREYKGRPIYGGKSEPYIMLWENEFVADVWYDIQSLPNLKGILGLE